MTSPDFQNHVLQVLGEIGANVREVQTIVRKDGQRLDKVEDRVADLERRSRDEELTAASFRNKAYGIVAAVSVAVSLAVPFLLKWIRFE